MARRRSGAALALALAGVALLAGGCGASSTLPAGWNKLHLASGAVLPYPPGWRQIAADPGSGSAALLSAGGTIRAYLNATPADDHETLADWTRFRLRHNAAEGNHDVRLLSSTTDVALDGGRAACVTDDYVTSRSAYREIACVVAPVRARGRTVLIAAAQPAAWAQEHSALLFAIHHFAA